MATTFKSTRCVSQPLFRIGQELITLPYPVEEGDDEPIVGGDRCTVVGFCWSPPGWSEPGWVYTITFPDGRNDAPWVKPGHREMEHERFLRPSTEEEDMTTLNRNVRGQFARKADEVRKVRTIRLTDAAWKALQTAAQARGMTAADLLEEEAPRLAKGGG